MNSIRKDNLSKTVVSCLVFVGISIQGSSYVLAADGVPIFAQNGAPSSVEAETHSTTNANVKYVLVNPGQYNIYFGRDPLDVIFTASAPFVTFPEQKTIAISGLRGVKPACEVKGGGNELHCKLLPQGSSTSISVSGDIQFKPIVEISSTTPSGFVATGGSVFYYRTSAPTTSPTYTGSVNFQIKVK
ncbi:hypothetical protein [Burkholderia alba]|uniref:hypothetical protein n=1 Tax=Burkholderia alba TaxID=2683677 RepID=UPI002B05C620|nr:hypothetical protein [Burkholderia alba]